MNICTYVTAVSLHPKLYAIAIYENTQTLENIKKSDRSVLQILRKPHIDLITLLGKKSGMDIDKQAFLEKKNRLENWRGLPVLKDAAAYLLLEKQSSFTTGDHELFTFSVKHYRTQHEKDVLMFQDLIDQKIIL